MKLSPNLIFCVASLLFTLGLCFVLYPYASLPSEKMASLTTPKPMEEFDEVIDLGEDYGMLTTIDLMAYYLDNPPADTIVGLDAPPPKIQFGGC